MKLLNTPGLAVAGVLALLVMTAPVRAQGACCLPDGSCIDFIDDFGCTLLSGDYQGDGTNCAVNLCPQTGQADRVSGSEKGSLLIFSKVEVRWGGVPPYPLIQDTFIDIANDYPENVQVQMYFINGDPPTEPDATGEREHLGWNWLDNRIELTGNEATYWSAATGQPKGVSPWSVLDPGLPPGRPAMDGTIDRVQRGYILAWAVNNISEEIRWNHLKGDAAIVHYGNGSAWEYNAWAVHCVSAAANGSHTDGVPGNMRLDGLEYSRPFDVLHLDFYSVNSFAFNGPRMVQIETDLTLHPVDVDLRQDNDGPVTTKAEFEIWNMDEVKFSGTTRCISCWDQTLLRYYGVPNHFYLIMLGTDKGRARIDGVASDVCDFDFLLTDGALGNHPLDIISVDTPLLGVQAKHLDFDMATFTGAAGGNLHGAGTQNALIQYDTSDIPPPQQTPGRVAP